MKNPLLVMTVKLDPTNPKSVKQDRYSKNVLNEFDKNYTRRAPKKAAKKKAKKK